MEKKDPKTVPSSPRRKKAVKPTTHLTKNDVAVLKRARVLPPTVNTSKTERSKKLDRTQPTSKQKE